MEVSVKVVAHRILRPCVSDGKHSSFAVNMAPFGHEGKEMFFCWCLSLCVHVFPAWRHNLWVFVLPTSLRERDTHRCSICVLMCSLDEQWMSVLVAQIIDTHTHTHTHTSGYYKTCSIRAQPYAIVVSGMCACSRVYVTSMSFVLLFITILP